LSKYLEKIRSPWLIAAIVIVIAIMIRVALSGADALERGRVALEEGDETMAVHHFREAISWYLPVAPWRDDAADALWVIHQGQAQSGMLKEAVQSLSMLRAGLMASRSLVGPDEDWRTKVDTALAPLMARWEAKAAAQEGRTPPSKLKEREEHFAKILAEDTLPSRLFGLMVVVGFCLWIVGVWRSTATQGRSRLQSLGLGAVGFVLFVLGLIFA